MKQKSKEESAPDATFGANQLHNVLKQVKSPEQRGSGGPQKVTKAAKNLGRFSKPTLSSMKK